jgi:phosphopantetheinyl transferase
MQFRSSFKTDSEWLESTEGSSQTVENRGFAPLNPSHPFRFHGVETACRQLSASGSNLCERYATYQELRQASGGDFEQFLSAGEREELCRWRDPASREAWMMGRFLSKQLVLSRLGDRRLDPASIEICSRDPQNRRVRPTVRVGGRLQPWNLSISHSKTALLAALSPMPEVAVGVDLTAVEEFSPGFLATWFTKREQIALSVSEPRQTAAYWAIKEAVYKAGNCGESFAPRRIEIFPKEPGKYGCFDRGVDLSGICNVRTWDIDRQVAVVVTLRRQKCIQTDLAGALNVHQ